MTQAVPANILVVGETIVDRYTFPNGDTVDSVGGSPYNVAVGLAALGIPVELSTQFGRDALGGQIADDLASFGRATISHGSTTETLTGTANASVDVRGVATYEFDLTWSFPARPDVRPRHLHTGSIAVIAEPGAGAVLQYVEEHAKIGTVSVDVNYRPAFPVVRHVAARRLETICQLAGIVKASEEDMAFLYPESSASESIRSLGASALMTVLTLGERGCLVWLADSDRPLEVAARRVRFGDAVGAGDAFMAGLLASMDRAQMLGAADRATQAWLANEEVLTAAARFGNHCGGEMASRSGLDFHGLADVNA